MGLITGRQSATVVLPLWLVEEPMKGPEANLLVHAAELASDGVQGRSGAQRPWSWRGGIFLLSLLTLVVRQAQSNAGTVSGHVFCLHRGNTPMQEYTSIAVYSASHLYMYLGMCICMCRHGIELAFPRLSVSGHIGRHGSAPPRLHVAEHRLNSLHDDLERRTHLPISPVCRRDRQKLGWVFGVHSPDPIQEGGFE
jgi:hypothetical protein